MQSFPTFENTKLVQCVIENLHTWAWAMGAVWVETWRGRKIKGKLMYSPLLMRRRRDWWRDLAHEEGGT